MIAIPILLGIFLVSKLHLGWKLWLIGAAIFMISQIFHLPFNSYLFNPLLETIKQSIQGVPGNLLVAITLGLSAGIFEETARYGMFRWWLKDNRSWKVAVLAGAGHGGIEAILLGGVVMVAYINMVVVRHSDLSSYNLTPDQLITAQQQIRAYWSLPWYDTLLGALERTFTIPFHIMASVLVLQVFTRKPGRQMFGWLGLAIVLHALMDASAVFIAGQWNAYIAEAVLGIMAILDVFILFWLRRPEPTPGSIPPASEENNLPEFTPKPVEETTENLDKTRYQ